MRAEHGDVAVGALGRMKRSAREGAYPDSLVALVEITKLRRGLHDPLDRCLLHTLPAVQDSVDGASEHREPRESPQWMARRLMQGCCARTQLDYIKNIKILS
jgi:hypothetical protein